VRRFIDDHADRRAGVYELLRLHDAAIHARRVRCPALCKLALRDEVVPAPAAASVFNALGTDPGRKWRHVTRYGHFDGGIADGRRHAAFERLVVEFLDPGREPDETMAELDRPRQAAVAT
jgi:cephalosporin-C deacetylase-like acetyl esterase